MKNLLITFTALMLVLGCTKVYTYKVPEEIKRNFSFKEGSYWIYRDSISGRVDSCYVSEISNSMAGRDYGGGRSESNYEIFSVYFTQKPIDKNIKDVMQWTIGYGYGFGLGYCTDLIKSDNGESFGLYEGLYPIRTSSSVEKYPNYTLNGKTYSDVYFLKNYKDSTNSIFFNDYVGFIKMKLNLSYETYDKIAGTFDTFYVNEVWELQRYKIIK